MRKLFLVAAVALTAPAFFVSGVSADTTAGICNSIVASGMQSAQTCENMSCAPGDAACIDVTNVFVEFVSTPGCLQAFSDAELNGLPGNASIHPNTGDVKHIQEVICGAVSDCGLCPSALVVGICVGPCTN